MTHLSIFTQRVYLRINKYVFYLYYNIAYFLYFREYRVTMGRLLIGCGVGTPQPIRSLPIVTNTLTPSSG